MSLPYNVPCDHQDSRKDDDAHLFKALKPVVNNERVIEIIWNMTHLHC